ncbi:YARHG domain-containing protein [Neobacillus dielmonensis]|uniref:YARHG domain-containing protein n=1 Tax=Neobacillus dielmonensis TaxID=1347369 RepID=UPI0005AABE41|nr:YARHG domain-containing protein [Neobacillus dielmonensis]
MAVFCTKCGRKAGADARFCPSCGNNLVILSSSTAVPQGAAGLANLNKPRTQNTSSSVNNTVPEETRIGTIQGNDRKNYFIPIVALCGIVLIGLMAYFTIGNKENSEPETIPSSIESRQMTDTSDSDTDTPQSDSDDKTTEDSYQTGSSDFILPSSSRKQLQDSDLSSLTLEELGVARNEIFARHGYIFQTEKYATYFSKKTWYSPNASYDGSLNELEKYNIQLIQSKEKSLQP